MINMELSGDDNAHSDSVSAEDPYMTSLIDLFGCGFIAAIFLFLLFAGMEGGRRMQAAVAAGVDGSQGVSLEVGAGAPALVEVGTPRGWAIDWGSLSRFQPGRDVDRDRVLNTVLIPDGDAVRRPTIIKIQRDLGQPAHGAIEITMQSGRSEAVASINADVLQSQPLIQIRLQGGRTLDVEPIGLQASRLQVVARSLDRKQARSARFLRLSAEQENCSIAMLGPRRRIQIRTASRQQSFTFDCGADSPSAEQEARIDGRTRPVCTAVTQVSSHALWSRPSGSALRCGP